VALDGGLGWADAAGRQGGSDAGDDDGHQWKMMAGAAFIEAIDRRVGEDDRGGDEQPGRIMTPGTQAGVQQP